MSDHPTAKCRCGTERTIPPDTKLLCTRCGMAFHAFEATADSGPRFTVRGEDLRAVALGREAREVRQAMLDGALPEPLTMDDSKALGRVAKLLEKERVRP